MVDWLSDGELSIEVLRKGAELVSLKKRTPIGEWVPFLYRDGETTAPPDGGWANHSTLMGYYIHRLWQQKTTYNGVPISGGTHGFLRNIDFRPPEKSADGRSLTCVKKNPIFSDVFAVSVVPFRPPFGAYAAIGTDLSRRRSRPVRIREK